MVQKGYLSARLMRDRRNKVLYNGRLMELLG